MKIELKHIRPISLSFLLAFFLMFQLKTACAQTSNMREWVMEHWEQMVNDNKAWIADNSNYLNDNEPYESYGMKWEWGFGNKSIKGTLYGMKEGEEAGTFWEFHSVWHPGEEIVQEFQFGSDGTLGMGELIQTGPNSVEQTMVFFAPDGSSYKIGHREEIRNGERHSQSFSIDENGEWQARRFYIWK